MKTKARLEHIASLIDERGFLSVAELAEAFQVSEMTIRRDLEQLDAQKRILRTYGGAASLRSEDERDEMEQKPEVLLVDQVDVLVATMVNPYYDSLLLDRVGKKNIPIIAESTHMPNQCTMVAVDNYQAGMDLGRWAGRTIRQQGFEKACLLDLTFHLENTQTRSRGFIAGLNEVCPEAEVVLSINAQSRYATAYQLARDALTVHPHINLIFAINDTTAWGAINACKDLNIDPARMTVVPFGLEGDTLKNALMADGYCKAGLAMFPEIVSLTCIEAAIAAYNHGALPENYVTPHVVLTARTLPEYYTLTANGWRLNWPVARSRLNIPVQTETIHPPERLPRQIGLIIPFSEHEWYRNLRDCLQEYSQQYGIGVQIIDADQNVRDEIELRRRQIARAAAGLIRPGEVVLIDSGPIARYLAEEIKKAHQEVTVITNSVVVFDTLNRTPGVMLISTGGAVRYSSQVLVGPTAESALKELRADKLFLMVSGITLDFGLSHTNISEVTIKQAMIRSAREVVLLADHTLFGTESVIQVAPLSVVNRLITDDALQPSTRLDISKSGIQILLVQM